MSKFIDKLNQIIFFIIWKMFEIEFCFSLVSSSKDDDAFDRPLLMAFQLKWDTKFSFPT